MDVLVSGGTPRRPGAAAVGAALALLAAGQLAAVQRTPPLPDDVRLQVPLVNYFLTPAPEGTAVSFELRNTGRRTVRVTDIGAVVPGLVLLDTTVAGEPVDFRSVGAGPDLLPAFDLAPRVAAVVTLVYRATECDAVPETPQPVTVRARVGRARGDLSVLLPELPDDAETARPEDVVSWQTALVRVQCA